MLIASAQSELGTFLLLGLSAENLTRLQEGSPIRISRESHGMSVPANLTIAIVTGEDERAIEADLRKMGLITEATVMGARQPS